MTIPTLILPRRGSALRSVGRFDGWTAFSFVAASLIALPILVVLSYVFVPTRDIWHHLATTVLPL